MNITITYPLNRTQQVLNYLHQHKLNYRASIADKQVKFQVFIDSCIHKVYNDVCRRLMDLQVENKEVNV